MSERKVYVADFETRNSDYDIAIKETSVWLWDICDIETLEHVTGDNIDTFMEHISKLGNVVIYFHNFDGFDSEFVMYWVLTHKYRFKVSNKLKSKEYTALIDDFAGIYNITICFDDGRRKHKGKNVVEFRDSKRKIPERVEKIAESYKLPIKKGEIDYRAQRGEGYKATQEEIEYIHNDTEIVARVLKLQYEKGMEHITSASDTFSMYKGVCAGAYKSFFPELPKDVDDFIRDSYIGGISYVNPKYQNRVIEGKVRVYDVNSMYPYQMCTEMLPYFYPVYEVGKIEGTKVRPLFIQRIRVSCGLKKGHMPSIILRKDIYSVESVFLMSTFDDRKYKGKNSYELDEQNGSMIELTLTNIDLELLFENYEIYEIEYIDGYSFMGSRNLFKDYIMPLYDMKSKLQKGAERELIKLQINSLYGKFGTKTHHIRQQPFLIDGIVRYGNLMSEEGKPVYTAVASFITAYARKQLFSVINAHLDTFVYCDTDSCHLFNDTLPEAIVDGKRIGAWDLEKTYTKSKYLKQKAYMGEREDGKVDIKLAGCPEGSKAYFNFDNFKFGSSVRGKLLPMHVKGGIVLVDTLFTIKDKI